MDNELAGEMVDIAELEAELAEIGVSEADLYQAEVDAGEIAPELGEVDLSIGLRVRERDPWGWIKFHRDGTPRRQVGRVRRDLLVEPIWQRQPKESEKQWQAFYQWLQMDVRDRSTARMGERYGVVRSTIACWAYIWQWEKRGREYSAFLFTQAQDEEIAQVRRIQRKRAVRQEQMEEELWEDAMMLRGKARTILNLPIVEEKYDRQEVGVDGVIHHHYTILPVRATFAAATSMMDTAAKLGDNSLGRPTQRISVETNRPANNLDEMDEEALTAHIETLKKRLQSPE